MDAVDIVELLRDGMTVLMLVSAPVMITAMVVGLAVSLVQALTQIQETTLTFVPKVTAMVVVLLLAMPYMVQTLQDYTTNLFDRIATIESYESDDA